MSDIACYPAPRRTLAAPVLAAAVLGVGLLLAACSGSPDDRVADRSVDESPAMPPALDVPPVERPQPSRGVVLLSIDTLRADHLGVYGYDRDTSPNLDALAARGVVFDAAFAHSPSTAISHMSLFTSLYPPEHGLEPPRHNALAETIPTLPEAFAAAGYRTAGHTEGGYMEGDHGFARGFEEWTDPGFESSTDVESTLDKGLAFLRSVAGEDDEEGDGEPFFLFLHTYSVHDPYEPPDAYRHRYWQGAPPTDLPASAETLEAANSGRLDLSTEQVDYFRSRYDDGIRYADQVVGRFVAELEALGLLDEITLVVTSDHGEEFHDHGRLLHTQVVPELLHVPLFVLHPGLTPRRVTGPVRLVDLAPTVLDLTGVDAAALPAARGVSLMPELTGQTRVAASDAAPGASYAEVNFLGVQRSLLTEHDGELWQIVEKTRRPDPDGTWISRSVDLDVVGRRVGLRLLSFHRPRSLRIEQIDAQIDAQVDPEGGAELLLERTLPPAWTDLEVRLSGDGERSRLRLSVDGCDVPEELGLGGDPRCLGFMLAEPRPATLELFSVRPAGGRLRVSPDRSMHRADVFRSLRQVLESLSFESVAAPASRELSEEERKALEALGYL